MINLTNLSITRGANLLIENANTTIYAGQKVGLVGNNGSGKSSLLATLRGEIEPDKGDINLPPNILISSVRQETPSLAQSALDYVLDGHRPYRDAQRAISTAEASQNGLAIATAHDQLATINGYALPAQAAALLHGLGFSQQEHQQAVSQFSGGWRMRLNLAQALIAPADLLLLDEPTNHLDLDAVIYLQDFLKTHPATQIIIAHDREFLDNLTTHILHIENRQLTAYKGNYSQFEQLRHEKRLQADAAYAKQAAARAHLQSYVDRFRAKASKAKQAQSRLKALAKLDQTPLPPPEQNYPLNIPSPENRPNPLLKLDNTSLGYDNTTILAPFTLTISPDTRLGLLGHNGAGKSTLIKTLAGNIAPLTGTRTQHKHTKIGYYTQHQLDRLNPEQTPLWHMRQQHPNRSEQEHRNFLGAYGFGGEKAEQPIAPLSGGEKARLALALIISDAPNVLLLDEPTNHLDLAMRDNLSRALQNYDSAIIIISHDRNLLRTVCNEYALIDAGKYQPYHGDLDDYRNQLRQDNQDFEQKTTNRPNTETRQTQKRNEAEIRRLLRPYKQAVEKYENQIEKLEAIACELEQQLAAPEIYETQNKDKLKVLLEQQTQNTRALMEVENQWAQALTELDAKSQQFSS